MNVVSCYRAAKIAQVSKQCIAKQKTVNLSNKSKYRYFSYDKDSGEFGIDIDSKHWSIYMEKRRNQKGYTPEKEKGLTTDTGLKSSEVDQKNDVYSKVRFDNLLKATYFVIVETYKPTDKQIKKLMGDISKRFEGMGN